MAWTYGGQLGVDTATGTADRTITLNGSPSGASVNVGDIVILPIGNNGGTLGTTPVSDSSGNTWNLVFNGQQGGLVGLAFAWMQMATGKTWTTSSTITVLASGLQLKWGVEWYQPAAGSTVTQDQQHSAGAASSTTPSSGATATLTGSDDLLFGGAMTDIGASTLTPTSHSPAWTAITTEPITSSSEPLFAHYMLGTYSTTPAYDGTMPSGDYFAGIVALSAAAAAVTPFIPHRMPLGV